LKITRKYLLAVHENNMRSNFALLVTGRDASPGIQGKKVRFLPPGNDLRLEGLKGFPEMYLNNNTPSKLPFTEREKKKKSARGRLVVLHYFHSHSRVEYDWRQNNRRIQVKMKGNTGSLPTSPRGPPEPPKIWRNESEREPVQNEISRYLILAGAHNGRV
jgi:hypothetical protein